MTTDHTPRDAADIPPFVNAEIDAAVVMFALTAGLAS